MFRVRTLLAITFLLGFGIAVHSHCIAECGSVLASRGQTAQFASDGEDHAPCASEIVCPAQETALRGVRIDIVGSQIASTSAAGAIVPALHETRGQLAAAVRSVTPDKTSPQAYLQVFRI